MIFISYSRTEHESRLATFLERSFAAAKLDVWRDTTQIRVGEAFAKKSRTASGGDGSSSSCRTRGSTAPGARTS
jgi:hypothetical protein